MFRFFSHKLTESMNYYVDWSRVSELLTSNSHRYSYHELFVRGSIFSFTVLSGFLGNYFNDEKKTHSSNLTMSIMAGFSGFFISHLVAILPLILKRRKMGRECATLITDILLEIENKQQNYKDFAETAIFINKTIELLMQASLSDEKRDRASQTWGWRKDILSKIKENLNGHVDDVIAFWNGGDEIVMIDRLNEMPHSLNRALHK